MKRALYGLTTVSFMLMLNHAYLTNVPFKNHLELSDYLLVYASNDLSQDVLIIETYDQNHQLVDVGQYKAGDAWNTKIVDDQYIILGGDETLTIDLSNGNVGSIPILSNYADLDRNRLILQVKKEPGSVFDTICAVDQFPLGANKQCIDLEEFLYSFIADNNQLYAMEIGPSGFRLNTYDLNTLQRYDTYKLETSHPYILVGIDQNHHLIALDEHMEWFDWTMMSNIQLEDIEFIKFNEPHYYVNRQTETVPISGSIDSYYQDIVAATSSIDFVDTVSFWHVAPHVKAPFDQFSCDVNSRYPWFNLRMIGAVWTGEKP